MTFLTRLSKAASALIGSEAQLPSLSDTVKPQKKTEPSVYFEQDYPELLPDEEVVNQEQFLQYLNSSTPGLTRREFVFDKLKFGDFPVLEHGKINNQKTFIQIKEEYVRQAFDAVKPYYDYVLHLPPISMNEEYAKCLFHIITRLIAIYWDMPASRNHHDSTNFGLLRHAVHVGTREALRLCRTNTYSQYAGLDSEATRKERPFIVICGFIIGILHDSDKMLQAKLTCNLQSRTYVFNPFHGSGSVLDFKLKYPRDKMTLSWEKSQFVNLNLGLHYLYSPMVPSAFRKALPGKLLDFIFTCIKNYKSSSDQIAAQFSQAQDNYLNEIRIALTRMLLVETVFNDLDGSLFKMSNNWYMAIQDRFIGALNTELRASENSIERVLIQNGILKTRAQNEFNGHRFSLTLLFPGARFEKIYVVSFYQASFIDSLPKLNAHRIGLAPIRIHGSHSDLLKNYGIELPPSAFGGSGAGKGAEKEPEKKEAGTPAQTAPDGVAPEENALAAPQTKPQPAAPQKEKRKKGKAQNPEQGQLHSGDAPSGAGNNAQEGSVRAENENSASTPGQDANGPQKRAQASNEPPSVSSLPLPLPGPADAQPPAPPLTRRELDAQAMRHVQIDAENYRRIPFVTTPKMEHNYQSVLSPAFYNALPHLECALAESLANGIGAATMSNQTFPNGHLQSSKDPNTFFYIRKNRSILARHPKGLQFAWGVMMHQHRQTAQNPWLKNIPDLPLSLNPTLPNANQVIGYCYLAWAQKGLLLPEGNQNKFQLNDYAIPLLKKKSKEPEIELANISGHFIALDLTVLLSCETARVGSKSLAQTIRYYCDSLYGTETGDE